MIKKVGSGLLTIFWNNHLIGDIPLSARFPQLFSF